MSYYSLQQNFPAFFWLLSYCNLSLTVLANIREILHIIRHIPRQEVYVSCGSCKFSFKKSIQKNGVFQSKLLHLKCRFDVRIGRIRETFSMRRFWSSSRCLRNQISSSGVPIQHSLIMAASFPAGHFHVLFHVSCCT